MEAAAKSLDLAIGPGMLRLGSRVIASDDRLFHRPDNLGTSSTSTCSLHRRDRARTDAIVNFENVIVECRF
ncbi:hypothetical protein GCM10008012_63540 [Rhizobium anhuiense]|uniref:Uncharacterized protein n=2 Tax=Rhizobium TaxID=379 RepID=A0A432N9V2_9HYPH|nr:hypothetical protein EEQ99_31100 [Rhizobium anhuiense]GGE12174.1 hypothetical protein GCM10008012_63540 [Rhizobium anhuiense]